MLIRLGDANDWPFIYNLGKTVIIDSISPWRRQPINKTLKYRNNFLKGFWSWIQQTKSQVFIAEDLDKNNNPVKTGYLVLYPESKEELTGIIQGWVMDLAVKKEYRGQGIGKALLQAAEDYCRQAGIAYLGLAVSSHNVRALGLYESLGFAEERKLMVKVLDEEDE